MFTFTKLVFQIKISRVPNRHIFFEIRHLFREAFQIAEIKNCEQGAFDRIFSQKLSADPSAVKRYQKPSLPFAFDLPVLLEQNNKTATVEIGLALAGSAVNDIHCFIKALHEALNSLSKTHGLEIEISAIQSVSGDGSRTVYTEKGSGLSLLTSDDLLQTIDLSESISITLYTPLILMQDGKPHRKLNFSDFIRPLMRRISSLAYYYAGSEPDIDFRRLSEESLKVESMNIDLRWEEWKGGISGLVGDITFNGLLQDYLPFILLGEQFHLGKGATYGMGRYGIKR